MTNSPKIRLRLDAKFVRTCEVPELIADVLHPIANYLELPVIDLYKIKKRNPETKKTRPISTILKRIFTSKSAEKWYEPLNSLDEEILRKHVWMHLPQLKFPISMSEWHKYGEAFANWNTKIDFELKPDRVVWACEPNGNKNNFHVLTRDSLNKLGLFEEDLVSDENTAIQECGLAEFTHIELLRDAIQRGEIEQLDPNSNMPTATYLPYGKISIKALSKYLKKFKITLDDSKANESPKPETDDIKGGNESEHLKTAEATTPADNEIFAEAIIPTKSRRRHRLRTNTLDPAIDKAIKLANGSLELAQVFLKLKGLALEGESPFTGVIDADALCYTNDKNIIAKLTKNALSKKLGRLRLRDKTN